MNSQSKQLGQPDQGQSKKLVIFIGCLHGKVTKRMIKELFKPHKIFNIKLKKKNYQSAGFGRFQVEDEETFDKIVRKNYFINQRRITCRKFYRGQQKEEYLESLNRRRILIAGFPSKMTDDELYSLFLRFATIERAYAIRDSSGDSLGYGFVNFASQKTAKEMIRLSIIEYGDSNILCLPFIKLKPGEKPPIAYLKGKIGYENYGKIMDQEELKFQSSSHKYILECNYQTRTVNRDLYQQYKETDIEYRLRKKRFKGYLIPFETNDHQLCATQPHRDWFCCRLCHLRGIGSTRKQIMARLRDVHSNHSKMNIKVNSVGQGQGQDR